MYVNVIVVFRCNNKTQCSVLADRRVFLAAGSCRGLTTYLTVQFLCEPSLYLRYHKRWNERNIAGTNAPLLLSRRSRSPKCSYGVAESTGVWAEPQSINDLALMNVHCRSYNTIQSDKYKDGELGSLMNNVRMIWDNNAREERYYLPLWFQHCGGGGRARPWSPAVPTLSFATRTASVSSLWNGL